MDQSRNISAPTVAFVWRGEASTRGAPIGPNNRLRGAADALEALGASVQSCVFDESVAEDVLRQLLDVDGVLVWVDPLSDGKTRAVLDPLLRRVAGAGVWVSAQPDIILKMGVKEVLYRTRDIGWAVDTDLYPTANDFAARFPERLASSGPRVLKQNRGNGGQGVWKVEQISGDRVRVLHALRGSMPEDLPLTAFLERCAEYFANDGRIIDQAYQPRLPEGMTRCYLSQDKVVGFGHQFIKALVTPTAAEPEPSGPRIMHGPDATAFQALREQLENEWIPAMQGVLDIATADLPALWDADFLLGAKTASGADTYVLCEINVSAVSPFPAQAADLLARAALKGAEACRFGKEEALRRQRDST